jgi:histidinol-phosphate/aromatic aminotransferase/cobyric acid decarboxylase-like protein
MSAYGLTDALRISIGTEEAMRKVATVLNGMGRDG